MKILITAGGTKVPIDSIRFIGNHSTGKTGADLADFCFLSGIEVDLITADNAIKPQALKKYSTYSTFIDLENSLKNKLKENHYHWVIHLAAVSDFEVKTTEQKLDSGIEHTLHLIPTKKIVNFIKLWQPTTKLIAFKLTHNISDSEVEKKVSKLLLNSQADYVVHNEWKNVAIKEHKFRLWDNHGKTNLSGNFKNELIQTITNIIQESL
jgi:phosphopantothenoylcysteine synthetase/decarboxylase